MKLFTNKLRYHRWLFLVVIVCFVGGLLLGGIHLTRATQTETPDCIQQTRPDCNKNIQQPTCPKLPH